MRILCDKTVALVIDFQERLFPFIHENELLLKNVPVLIKGLKILNIPFLITEQYVQGLGSTVQPIAACLEGVTRIEKSTFSCCDEPKFMLELASSAMENVIVMGIESHVCVLQTVIDLIRNGYRPIVVEDCISSRKENDKRIAIGRMRKEGAFITTYESILFELLRVSGTAEFKSISKLVK